MLEIDSHKTRIIQYTKNIMFNVVLSQYQKCRHNVSGTFYIRLYILGKLKTEKKSIVIYTIVFIYIFIFLQNTW